MNIAYKGTMKKDKSSKKYKTLKVIMEQYGCLHNFLKEIKLEIDGVRFR